MKNIGAAQDRPYLMVQRLLKLIIVNRPGAVDIKVLKAPAEPTRPTGQLTLYHLFHHPLRPFDADT
jgi:hypothetical protein